MAGIPGSATTPRATGDDSVRLASLNRRFGALLVDWILCLLVAMAFVRVPFIGQAALPILVVEYAFFIGLFTQTPGMRLFKIRAIASATGGRLGIPRAFLRGLLLALVIPAVLMDDYGRGYHDRWSGSIMVRA